LCCAEVFGFGRFAILAAFSENEAIHGLTPSGLKFSEKFSTGRAVLFAHFF
jgi:hypothetical protein